MELPLASNSDASDESSEEELKETLSKRRSKELIVALSGPVGCGIEDVRDALERELKDAQYEVVHVKVSDLMKAFISQNDKFKSSNLIDFLPHSIRIYLLLGIPRYFHARGLCNERQRQNNEVIIEN